MPGGPSQHGGNRFHYLYAARYIIDLLDPKSDVCSVWLEGYPDAIDDDILDVAIQAGTTLKAVQVKWSLDGTLTPSDAYEIFSRLWSNKAITDHAVGSTSLVIATNRNLSPRLQEDLEVARLWGTLDSAELASRFAAPDIGPIETRLKEGLTKVTNGIDDP